MLRKLLILVAVSSLIIATNGTALCSKGLHMELPAGKNDVLPPNGTSWHEIYTSFCQYYTQHGYSDNGDGVVSYCDYIDLVNATTGGTFRHHIQEVYTTYVCEPMAGKTVVDYYFESIDDQYGNPVGSTWHAVYPADRFCEIYEVTDWHDATGNQIVDPCDEIFIVAQPGSSGTWVHVIDVSLDIVVDDGTAVDRGTWGRIKSFFGELF